MNKLIEKYINDNKINLNCFKIAVLSFYLIELIDINNQKLSILNMFDDIIIYIDNIEYGTYYFNDKVNLWLSRK